MKNALPSGRVLAALILNLALGNLILLTDGSFGFWNVCLSLACLVILPAGFRRAARQRNGLRAALVGLLATLLIPVAGMFLSGIVAGLLTGKGAGEVLGTGMLSASLFGVVGGWPFSPPFLAVNAFLCYRHWRASRPVSPA